jgi:hypothetical protein
MIGIASFEYRLAQTTRKLPTVSVYSSGMHYDRGFDNRHTTPGQMHEQQVRRFADLAGWIAPSFRAGSDGVGATREEAQPLGA